MITRARKVKFIRDYQSSRLYGLQDAVKAAFREHGVDWLTDDQLADMAEITAQSARRRQHMNMRNRARRRVL